jgi:RimJ/RimL family protein N-acetyltransferase
VFLRTKRLRIVPLIETDANELVGLLDPQVNAYLLPEDKPTNEHDLREHYRGMQEAARQTSATSRFIALTVRLIDGDRAIGRIEALVHGRDAEIAFLFVASSWGNGFATEAVQAVAAKLKSTGVARLWACVSPENSRSLALCQRLSFEPAAPPRTFVSATFDEGDDVLSVNL